MTMIPSPPVRSDVRPRPLERLEAEIVALATQLTSATARLLVMIGEFDEAEGWRDWGMRSTAHWLTWKCGVGMNAGREQVRVARAMRQLPEVSKAFHEGRLSYSKVRALTRCATADNEVELVAAAECATAAQMEQLQAGLRRARTGDDVRKRHAARRVHYRFDDDGSVVGTFRLPPEEGARFVHALDVARGRSQRAVLPDGDVSAETSKEVSAARTAADALMVLADHFVDGVSADTPEPGRARYLLVIHSTLDALSQPDDTDDDGAGSELADRTRLAPSTARRLTCNCPTTTMTHGPDGQILHAGRRTRRIRGRLLRAVNARDRGRCRTPGCTERATQIHHVRHWANDGPTCLPNLISLCDAHRWAVHEGGFTLVPRRPGQWALLSPAGVTIDDTAPPPPTVDPLPEDPTLGPDAVSGHWDGERMRLQDAVTALSAPPAKPRQTIPWKVMAKWHDGIVDLQRRARTDPHIIVSTDQDD